MSRRAAEIVIDDLISKMVADGWKSRLDALHDLRLAVEDRYHTEVKNFHAAIAAGKAKEIFPSPVTDIKCVACERVFKSQRSYAAHLWQTHKVRRT